MPSVWAEEALVHPDADGLNLGILLRDLRNQKPVYLSAFILGLFCYSTILLLYLPSISQEGPHPSSGSSDRCGCAPQQQANGSSISKDECTGYYYCVLSMKKRGEYLFLPTLTSGKFFLNTFQTALFSLLMLSVLCWLQEKLRDKKARYVGI